MNRVVVVICTLVVLCFISHGNAFSGTEEVPTKSKEKRFEPYSVGGVRVSSKNVNYLGIAYWKDKKTNLFWTNGESKKDIVYRTWDEAVYYCNNLKYDKKTNWRLATKEELEEVGRDSQIYNLNKYIGIGSLDSWFWSSSFDEYDSSYIWLIFMKNGISSYVQKSTESYGVICVHD